jgi:molybdopterin-guanine dinucleotide biosynthesis protein A
MTAFQTPGPQAGSVAGLVLAGGRSSRFGGEKAAAALGGRSLLIWAVNRLQATCGWVAVNARRGAQAEALAVAHGLPVLHDVAGDADGPLAGVRAGLSWAAGIGARALAVSPCDTPFLPDDLFARLIQAAGPGAAMAATAEGRQPLCAVWPVDALPLVAEALAGGGHPPTWQVLERLGAIEVGFDGPEAFVNLNTLEDLAAAEARLA